MVLVDAFDGELICEYGVQEQGEDGEECRLDAAKNYREIANQTQKKTQKKKFDL